MESDEDEPIPGPSWAIPEVRTKNRVFSNDQKERKRAYNRNSLAKGLQTLSNLRPNIGQR